MAKRTSTLRQSKTWENRVSRYLFGKDRDWKEQWDVSGLDAHGHLWIGEVKCRTRLTFAEGCKLMEEAWDQLCEAVDPPLNDNYPGLFVVIHTKGCPLEKDWVSYWDGSQDSNPSPPEQLSHFREYGLGFYDDEQDAPHLTADEEDGSPD